MRADNVLTDLFLVNICFFKFERSLSIKNVDTVDPSQAPEWLRACRIAEHRIGRTVRIHP